jgi:hypothetical protein
VSGKGLSHRLRAKLPDWRDLLGRDVEDGRDALRKLVTDPFRFTPIVERDRRGYQFTALLALDRVVSWIVELPDAGLAVHILRH